MQNSIALARTHCEFLVEHLQARRPAWHHQALIRCPDASSSRNAALDLTHGQAVLDVMRLKGGGRPPERVLLRAQVQPRLRLGRHVGRCRGRWLVGWQLPLCPECRISFLYMPCAAFPSQACVGTVPSSASCRWQQAQPSLLQRHCSGGSDHVSAPWTYEPCSCQSSRTHHPGRVHAP